MIKRLTAWAKHPLCPAVSAAAVVFAYLVTVVDPSVFYEDDIYFPAFQYGAEFLRPFLRIPGGLSEYAAAYLAQACWNRWLGGAVFTALALFVGASFGAYLRQAFQKRSSGLWLLPVYVAVLIWTRYGFHLESVTALAFAMLAATAYAHRRFDSVSPAIRAPLGIALFGVCYWLCGAAVYVCVLLSAAVEHERRRQVRLSALLLVAGGLMPLVVGHLIVALPFREALFRLLPHSNTRCLEGGNLLGLLYGLALMPGLILFLRRDGASQGAWGGRLAALAGRLGRRVPRTPRRRAAVVAILAAGLLFATRSPITARKMAIRKCVRLRAWNSVLALAAELPRDRFPLGTSYAVNQALYRTGELGSRMFAFPQAPLSLTLGVAFASCPNADFYRERPMAFFKIGAVDLQMGLVNQAEHVAHEALELLGPHPTILQRLAFINLIKRRPETARVYLNALCRDPVARTWARNRLQTLDRTPEQLLEAPFIARLRENMPSRQDINVPMMPLAKRCLSQLDENPKNRMAFEYLMADLLIRNDLEGVVRELPRARDMGYDVLPRHYQEAVVLYEHQTGRKTPEPGPLVQPGVRQEFQRFMAAIGPHLRRSDPAPAMAAAAPFIHTYFYHHVFRR